MRYKELKIGKWYSVGIDEVRNEYILESFEGACNALSYYSITKEEFDRLPCGFEDLKKYCTLRRFLCSNSLIRQNFEQLCRLYEKEIDESEGSILICNQTKIYRTEEKKFICMEILDKNLPYFIYGLGNQSVLPNLIVECLFGLRYPALKAVKPTAKDIVMDYINKHNDKFKIVDKVSCT